MAKRGPQTLNDELYFLQSRNMKITKKDLPTLQAIGLAKVQRYAAGLLHKPMNTLKDYHEVAFRQIVRRYQLDRRLRYTLLFYLLDFEGGLKNAMAQVLAKYGYYGYLDFSQWAKTHDSHQLRLPRYNMINGIKQALNQDGNRQLLEQMHFNDQQMPRVREAMNLLAWGDLMTIFALMSRKNRSELAQCFQCSPADLLSWLTCLRTLRNLCAHDNDVLDIEFHRAPNMRSNWRNFLEPTELHGPYHLAVAIYVLVQVMLPLFPQTNWDELSKSLRALCSGNEQTAATYGFKNADTAVDLTFVAGEFKN